jgi:hypothetical protein
MLKLPLPLKLLLLLGSQAIMLDPREVRALLKIA